MKLQDYNPFITIRELFGILLPGAIITIGCMWYFKSGKDGLVEVLTINGKVNSFLLGLVFLLVSYFFGHLVFQIGSLIDDFVYDPLKGVLYDQKRLQIVKDRLRDRVYKDEWQTKLSTFDWSLNRLRQLKDKGLFNEVESIVADAKFFRATFLLGIIGSFVYEVTNGWQFSNIYLFLTAFIALLILRKLLILEKEKKDALEGEILESTYKQKQHYNSWKWSFWTSYACLILIQIFLAFSTSNSSIVLPILLSTVTVSSLVLYIHIRQKSCKTLYKHIIFLDRKLISDKTEDHEKQE